MTSILFQLEFREKLVNSEKRPRSIEGKASTHICYSAGIKAGTNRWEAISLATTPSLLKCVLPPLNVIYSSVLWINT